MGDELTDKQKCFALKTALEHCTGVPHTLSDCMVEEKVATDELTN